MTFTIQKKLLLISACVVLGLAIIFIQNTRSTAQLNRLATMLGDTKDLQISILQLRRNEKDFLMRKNVKYLDRFNSNISDAQLKITRLSEGLSASGIDDVDTQELSSLLTRYQNTFSLIVSKSEINGLDKDSGHLGALRQAAHEMESSFEGLYNWSAQVMLLTLRRHEKDFMLRNDKKYLTRFQQVAKELSFEINSNSAKLLGVYVDEFEKYVANSEEIGLSENAGLMGVMRSAVHDMETRIDSEVTILIQHIDAQRKQSSTVNLLITGLICIGLFVSILLLGHYIITPLKTLALEFSQIRENNDLSQRVTVSEDEVGEAAANFNSFMAHFQGLVKNINFAVESLSNSTEKVSLSVNKTAQAITQQSQESDMVAAAITQLGVSATEIANNAESTTKRTSQATANAKLGHQELDNTITQVNGLSAQLMDAAEKIQMLQERSNGIGAVLGVIQGIAEQTNLLALNAAIEAARAGEQGRGFAVVADEVRSLAVRTQESTSEISGIIDELQRSTGEIVSTIISCKDNGVMSADKATKAGEVLNLILDDIHVISQMTDEIAHAVGEQSTVVQDIDKSIVSIRDIGEQIAEESQGNADASDEVVRLANTLNAEARVFKV